MPPDLCLNGQVEGVLRTYAENPNLARVAARSFAILLPGCRADTADTRGAIARTRHGGQLYPDLATTNGFRESESRRPPVSGYALRQLMAHEDAALYQQKHAGRNRVALRCHG